MKIELSKQTRLSTDTFLEDIWYWVRVEGTAVGECFRKESDAIKYMEQLKIFLQKHGQVEPKKEILKSETV